MYDPIQAKVMHHTPGMLKWPINNNEIWYGRKIGVTGSFKFDENIKFFRNILETLQC